MKIKYVYKRVIDRVIIEHAEKVDRSKFGAKIGVTRQRASQMLATGIIPGKYHDKIKKTPLLDVVSEVNTRKSLIEKGGK